MVVGENLTRLEEFLDEIEEGRKTVLVVDDNTNSLNLYRIILEKEGYTIIGTTTGEEAIDFCQNYNIGLVLMDLALPDESGIDVGEEIINKYEIPVVAVTALPEEYCREECLEKGFSDFFSKTDSTDKLVELVRTYLG